MRRSRPRSRSSESGRVGHAHASVFEVTLWLHPPELGEEAVSWQLPLVARRGWRMPFAVLLGQRGWLDRFPTRIDATTSTVEV